MHSETAYEHGGYDHGEIGASVIIVDAPPGRGPKLYIRSYAEIFVVLEGHALPADAASGIRTR